MYNTEDVTILKTLATNMVRLAKSYEQVDQIEWEAAVTDLSDAISNLENRPPNEGGNDARIREIAQDLVASSMETVFKQIGEIGRTIDKNRETVDRHVKAVDHIVGDLWKAIGDIRENRETGNREICENRESLATQSYKATEAMMLDTMRRLAPPRAMMSEHLLRSACIPQGPDVDLFLTLHDRLVTLARDWITGVWREGVAKSAPGLEGRASALDWGKSGSA